MSDLRKQLRSGRRVYGARAGRAIVPVGAGGAWRSYGLWRHAARAALRAAGTLLGVTFATFTALRLIPGNPLMLLNAGHTLDPTVESVWRIRHGFDQPIILQYLFYLRNLIEGDFGLSYYYSGRPVVELLAPAVRTTIEWQIPALLVAVIGAVGVAIATSVYRKQWLDSATTTLLSIGLSFPEFVIATFLVLVFSIRLRVLPVAGTTTPIHLVLPIVTMAIPLCAALSQVLRSELAEVIQQNYVRTARAKGLTEHRVLMVHALPNAILPFLTVVAIQVGRCIGGAFLIETIYNIPGVGWLVVSSVLQRDYPVVLAVTMVMTFAFVINSLVFDLVSGILDPRVCFVAKEQERL